MSRLNDLIRQVGLNDESLATELRREFSALADRRAFGLNFERHVPEAVELPGRPVRKGDKVRILPPRGTVPKKENDKLWRVTSVTKDGGSRIASLEGLNDEEDSAEASTDDLVVVAEFRDPIYPGLVSTGKVERGGDKPFHTVINAENFHALQTLLFTHRGKIDAIYIDPPYNTGARDWKYNNDYVEQDDHYRHSKWLAFMERRLQLAKELLNPEDSVLIVTIDEKEYARLGMLLEQIFPEARIQMISSVINPAGVARRGEFARTDEYLYVVMFGDARPKPVPLGKEWLGQVANSVKGKLHWNPLMRTGTNARRVDRPNLFYPLFVSSDGSRVTSVGEPLALSKAREHVETPEGTIAIWPMRTDGSEGNWQIGPEAVRDSIALGYLKLGGFTPRGMAVTYLKSGERKKVEAGLFPVVGRRTDGSVIVDESDYVPSFVPGSQWAIPAHDSSRNGSNLLRTLLPGRKFPFPKSLYAVEDILRFFVRDRPEAVILDFFSGSGTTTHAVIRLNKQDGGRRRSISVTNNEVSADEQRNLRQHGLRPGDPDWEALGICDHVTKPRIRAAITGRTPLGDPIKGAYKFTDEFPMADGFEENVEFLTLTYEAPLRVASHREFARIAPLLWMRAGSQGRRIDDISMGWDVAETYGVLADLDQADAFADAVAGSDSVRMAFIVTNEERLFEAIVRSLPEHAEAVRLYEAYLRNFEIEAGRSAR